MMSIIESVQSFLQRYLLDQNQLPENEKVIVAVSGGPDSLVLLHILSRQGLLPRENLLAAHLDHNLRPESAIEAAFVADTATKWKLVCKVGSIDVLAKAREEGLSLEEAGRMARYRFLADAAHELGAGVIATGHNADDQAETVLMHFLRGAGLAGLRGMLPIGPLPGEQNLSLIRPLLTTTRDEIEAYCREYGLTPLQDASNEETTFFRNWLRHEALPLLSSRSTKLKDRLRNTAAIAAADYELLQTLTARAWETVLRDERKNWLELDRDEWLALPLSLRRSVLRYAVWRLNPNLRDVGFRSIELALKVAESGRVGAKAVLPGKLTLRVEYDNLILSVQGDIGSLPDLPQLETDRPLPLKVPGKTRLSAGWAVEATIMPSWNEVAVKANRDPWLAFVDARWAEDLHIRGRNPGERFQPLGMKGQSAKVSNVMINRKILVALRQRWPIIASPEHLVWIVGHQVDQRAQITAESREILMLRASQKIS